MGQPENPNRIDGTHTAIVVVGGDPLHPAVADRLPPAAHTICADSGLDHALAAGLNPTLVVGDLDSASPSSLEQARTLGVPIREHPVDKDATDTELALQAACAEGVQHLVMVGGGGDRLDHLLGALLALADPSLGSLERLEAWWGQAHVTVLHGPRAVTVEAPPGATLSLLAVAGPCSGVTTSGLRWPLEGDILSPTSSRGVSNVVTAHPTVQVHTGVLFVINPHALGGPS